MKFTKKNWITLIVGLSLVVVSLSSLLVLKLVERRKTLTNLDHTLAIKAEQVEKTQKINVSWQTNKLIDSITIEVKHGKDIVSKVEIHDPTTIIKGCYQIEAFYGKQSVKVITSNAEGKYEVTKTKTTQCDLWADKYVIAPITATMPVTLFTLSLEEITDNYQTPTFVWFRRSGVWDYNEMPDNVKLIPVLDVNEFKHDTDQSEIYEKVSKWVKELYEINSNSHFDFYYNDYFPHGWMQATIGNNIPTENYHVTLLSDGAGSFIYFNECFDNDNVDQVYASMKQKYDQLKTQVKQSGGYEAYSDKYSIDSSEIRKYIYHMVKEESNVEWWLTRISGTLAVNNSELYAELEQLVALGDIKVKDLKTLLFAHDEVEKEQLKKLYNFSDTMFERAHKENKEVMVFLGTWNSDEAYFVEYVNILKEIYGDKYVYYYKGHPKSPTETIKGKFEKLEAIDIIDIDSTIPAELIFFFNPEIFASGYQTSTFYSIEEEKSLSVVNLRKENLTEDYKENIKSFISKVENTDEAYGSLVTSNNCFVVEFANVAEYDIAIYDATEKTMTYYKKSGQTYNKVNI